jgi:DNA polymerase-3 subunit gamma/tau
MTSYLVIARKWRPQTLDEVIGQPHVTRTLRNAVQAGRVAHAYLFTGARGVGKTSVARILAKTLNCEKELAQRPCNTCSNCREITQGNSVDVLEVDGASNRGIDSIRELRETVRYRPAKSRSRIYIIDEVHMLTTEAFNALLKTLEEPPDHVVFLFATTEPHKIPPTILSRCQRFDFRRIPTRLIVEHLRKISLHAGSELSEVLLYAVAREADGSMRDAQSLLEQILAFSDAGLSDEEMLDVLGVVDRSTVLLAGKAVVEGDARGCLQVVESLYSRGIDCRRFCLHLCDHFRNLLFLAISGEDTDLRLELPEEEKEMLRAESRRTTPEFLHLAFQILLKGEEDIRRATLPKIALEMLLLRLATLPSLESMDRLLDRLSSLEDRLSEGGGCLVSERVTSPFTGEGTGTASFPGGSPTRHPLDCGPEMQASVSHHEMARAQSAGNTRVAPGSSVVSPEMPVGDRTPSRVAGKSFSHVEATLSPEQCPPEEVPLRWPQFIQWSQARYPVLAAKLSQSQIRVAGEEALELEVMEVFEDSLKDPQSLDKLKETIREFFGTDFHISLRRQSAAHLDRWHSQKSRPSKTHEKFAVMEHPVVQQAMEILGAELIEIRPLKPGENRERRTHPDSEEHDL